MLCTYIRCIVIMCSIIDILAISCDRKIRSLERKINLRLQLEKEERSDAIDTLREERVKVEEMIREERMKIVETLREERSKIADTLREERTKEVEILREERMKVVEILREERTKIADTLREERTKEMESLREERTEIVENIQEEMREAEVMGRKDKNDGDELLRKELNEQGQRVEELAKTMAESRQGGTGAALVRGVRGGGGGVRNKATGSRGSGWTKGGGGRDWSTPTEATDVHGPGGNLQSLSWAVNSLQAGLIVEKRKSQQLEKIVTWLKTRLVNITAEMETGEGVTRVMLAKHLSQNDVNAENINNVKAQNGRGNDTGISGIAFNNTSNFSLVNETIDSVPEITPMSVESSDDITALTIRIDKLSMDVHNTQNMMARYEANQTDMTDIKLVQKLMLDWQINVEDWRNRFTEKVDSIENMVMTYDANITHISDISQAMTGDIEEMRIHMMKIESNVTESEQLMKTNLQDTQNCMAKYEEKLNNSRQAITSMQNRITKCETDVTTLTDNVEQLHNRTTICEVNLSEVNQRVSKEITGIKQRISNEKTEITQRVSNEINGITQKVSNDINGIKDRLSNEITGIKQRMKTWDSDMMTVKQAFMQHVVSTHGKKTYKGNVEDMGAMSHSLNALTQRVAFLETCESPAAGANTLVSYKNQSLVPNTQLPSGAQLLVRCSDPGRYTMSGTNIVTCKKGCWTSEMPMCKPTMELVMFYVIIHQGKSYYYANCERPICSVTDLGSVLVRKGVTMGIYCSFKSKTNHPSLFKNGVKIGRDDLTVDNTSIMYYIVQVTAKYNGPYTCKGHYEEKRIDVMVVDKI